MNVRVRGIYATALTALFGDETVVQASPAIRERFDAEFPVAPAAAAIETTDDRQGVTLVGARGAVERARERLAGVSRDTLAWGDAAPQDAVFEGVVTETLGSGAVVDLGDAEGFLPYDAVDGYVETDDRVRVQVRRSEPPWLDRRPRLDADIEVSGALVRLVRGTANEAAGGAQLVDILPVDVPDGWVPRWGRDEEEASMDALGDALDAAADRADLFDVALADATGDDAPARLATPLATAHVWFGREGRFALDGKRRGVTATMPGHHRTKAATDAASAAVDFVEALTDPGPDGEFPFGVATRQFGPREGDRLRIEHGKPDGRLITLGQGAVTERDPDGEVRMEREMHPGGQYDALDVERRAGDVAVTKFVEGRWWYATVYRGDDGTRRGTYVNVCTPVEVFPDAVRYVDLHVDVVKGPDGDVRRVDDDELDAAVAAGNVSEPLAERARAVAAKLEEAL
ncbi:RNA-binding protein [Halobacteriales archaeon QS_9_67_17]|nr:MAG: RNA-binding protein [Halobacteriales archaeon QS_9_67_17]